MANMTCLECCVDLGGLCFSQPRYCPNCGTLLLKKQQEVLRRMATDDDIDDYIRGKVLDTLGDIGNGELTADELPDRVWETENCDGVMFYSNVEADNFVRRHLHWVNSAFEFACNTYGDDRYVEMRANCEDTFLVVAFIEATRIYVYDQLGIDMDEGTLSKKRIREIIKQVKNTPYRAEW